MSACGEFAEHVWKPGSCKNCFHPRSAHGSGPSAEDEDGPNANTAPHGRKPTIAVRPTVMSTESRTDINMNTEQDTRKISGLRKALDLPPLILDGDGCSRTLRETLIQQFLRSPTGSSRDDGSLPDALQENGNADGDSCLSNGNGNATSPGRLSVEDRLDVERNSPTPDSFHSLSDSDRSSTDSLTAIRSPQSSTNEPIYAESTKRKRPAEATISVMAARSEENNRTFYLSSPDSAVSTQCPTQRIPFSPSTPIDPSRPAFPFPNSPDSSSHARPQSSPPVPPKSQSRPPRLGLSSLPCAPLPELSFHVPPAPDVPDIPGVPNVPGVHSVPGDPGIPDVPGVPTGRRSLESLVEEERELVGEGASVSINAPVESREWSRATPGTDSSSCSPTPERHRAGDTDAPEPAPPPPPPKKHHRVCSRLGGSVMDLQRSGQQDSLENLSQSLRGLNCCTNASSDSLQALSDTDSALRSSPSPFPSSPFGSAPASPQPDAFPSNSLSHQLQPPPLPQKKLVNRTVSAPSDAGVKPLARARPRLPFSGSETNISRPAGSTLQLHALLSNMDSREGIYSKLGGLYAESLRRLALKCEEHFSGAQRDSLRFDESNWSLFKLTCNKPCCVSGDAVYYSASCASDTHNTYAVKICKGQAADSRQAHLYGLSVQQSVPPHFNLQQDCGHFIACVPQSMLAGEEGVSGPARAEQERVVVITREVPQQSVGEFVREWASFHRSHPEAYERRVCFLLLQLCAGLEHLKAHGVTHRDLCMENLLLVPRRRTGADPQQSVPRLLICSFTKAKICTEQTANGDARLAPEIVSAAQYRKFDEFQTGILIYELLHQRNPFEAAPALRRQEYRSAQLPPVPEASIYSPGLQRLAHLLLEPDPGSRICIRDARRVLQALLWGPRRDLMELRGPQSHSALMNWLDVKRALIMMKFAERSLEPQRNAELEDWMCCEYFSRANPRALTETAELLYGTG